ncbi:Ubiquitin--protein ligase [Bertholletia excelsa]
MSTAENSVAADIESGRQRRINVRHLPRPSHPGSSETFTDGSLCFSGSDDDDDQSWHSPEGSTAGGSFDEGRFSEIEGVVDPRSRVGYSESDCDVDLESGELEMKVHPDKEERDCRICHLNLVGSEVDRESGVEIELGCSCKGDLAAAHKQCAETWFKIRGNTTCEICGSTALNVIGELTGEGNTATESANAAPAGLIVISETQNFWHGRRVMNFLLACMVFAFIISWLFHFNVIS